MQVTNLSEGKVALSGELKGEALLNARTQLEALIDSGERAFAIDLSAIETINSQVLSLCLCLLRKAESCKVGLSFDNPPSKLYDMARVGGLEFVLGVQP